MAYQPVTQSLVSTANSTASALGVSAVFTGTSEDISNYASITVAGIASHASATNGLSIQQSADGTNWDITDVYTVAAATPFNFGVQVSAKFFRIVYTNGATLQTSFRLQSIFHAAGNPDSSQRPQDGRTNEIDTQENSSFLMGYNGTTWDRVRTKGTGVLSNDVTSINNVTPLMGNGVTGTGSQRVTVASDNTPFPIKLDQTTVGTTNAVSIGQLGATTVASNNGTASAGTLRVAIASDNTANSNPWLVRHAASTTSSGLLYAKILAAATTNATLVLTGARAIYGWHLYNNGASARYVRIYNKATAPTVGTDSPVFVLPLPAGGGAVLPPQVMNFSLSLGFGYSITSGSADLDATAVTAGDVVGTIFYI